MLVPSELLRAARVATSVSQLAFARSAGLGAATLARLEAHGKASPKTYRKVVAVFQEIGFVFAPSEANGIGPSMRLPAKLGDRKVTDGDVLLAAAEALGWTARILETKSGVSERTIAALRAGRTVGSRSLGRIRSAVEAAGVLMLEAGGGSGPGFAVPMSIVANTDLRF